MQNSNAYTLMEIGAQNFFAILASIVARTYMFFFFFIMHDLNLMWAM